MVVTKAFEDGARELCDLLIIYFGDTGKEKTQSIQYVFKEAWDVDCPISTIKEAKPTPSIYIMLIMIRSRFSQPCMSLDYASFRKCYYR